MTPLMRRFANTSFVVLLALTLAMLPGTLLSRESTRTSLQISASGPGDGTCSAALPDGRSFVTGGSNSAGPLAGAEYFGKDGQFSSAAPMLNPRKDHICIALDDTTILVAGGDTGKNGATTAAEIFHSDTNTW